MVLLWSMLLVILLATVECQVVFPTGSPKPSIKIEVLETCNATNGQAGTCYEFRSDEFKSCSRYFPSIDSSIPDVASHLTANLCRNTGGEAYFCCPADQRPDFIPGEDVCGKALSFNVVGGESTEPGEWPWLAAIGWKSGTSFNPFCGGTLITKQHVITAAHCFRQRFSNTVVRLGEYNVTVNGDGAQDFDIMEERIANWDNVTKENDLMLLKLDRPIDTFTDAIRPACLPYHLRNAKFSGETLTVVGWGVYDNNNTILTSTEPLKGHVPVVPISECQESYKGRNNKIDDRQLCAGTGGTDSCRGDSGGPLNYVDTTKGSFYVVGVVSFGPTPCGSSKLPGVYARIGHYLNWIEENIRELL